MTSNLNKHLQAKQDRLSNLEQTLRDIQAQLTALNQELRVEQQLAKAQETIAKEFTGIKASLTKLVKDACSCYEPEALDDMLLDLSEIVESVKSEYASYQLSDRFLNQATSEIEDNEVNPPESAGTSLNDIPMLASPLPPRDDTQTILTSTHILTLVNEMFLGIDEVQRIQSALGIPGRFRKLETLAIALAEANLTAAKFHSIVELLNLGGTSLSLNGSSTTNTNPNPPEVRG
jgi:hypothetical protein